MKTITLGNEVIDQVTGCQGVAYSRLEYLNGCIQIGVKPKCKEPNIMPEIMYIDIQQLEVVGRGIVAEPKPTGGISDNVPKSVSY